MDADLLRKLVQQAVDDKTAVLRAEIENFKTEKKTGEEMGKLKTENKNCGLRLPKWIET